MPELTFTQTPGVRLTIVVPALREARRLESSLPSIADHLEQRGYPSELIVVDDGSPDDTSEVARRIAPELGVPVHLIRYEVNRGKGFALKVEFERARGTYVIFTDVDLSTPIEEVDRLLEQLEADYDVVIASREMEGSSIEVHQSWARERMGGVFTAIARRTFVDVSDITCGFKGFGSSAGRDVFARARIDDWSFDVEVLSLAKRHGHRIREIPVRWIDHDDTKVRVLRDALVSLWRLFRIRWLLRIDAYTSEYPISEECEHWRSPSHLCLDRSTGT